MADIDRELSYLVDASESTRIHFAASRLNRAANLRKELQEVVTELVDALVAAELARLLPELRAKWLRMDSLQESFDFSARVGPQAVPASRPAHGGLRRVGKAG